MTDPQTIIADEGAPNLAVDILPDNAPGTFLLDVSEVDGGDLLGWGMDGWANIVCDVMRVRTVRGAQRLQGPRTRAEAGLASVVLSDTARRFDPMVNADAIHSGTPLRVRAWAGNDSAVPEWSAVLFTGRIGTDLEVSYSQASPPVVTFTAVDIISRLARYRSVGRDDPGVGAGDHLRSRVARVLAELGLPESTLDTDSDTAYRATLAPTPLVAGWDEVSAAADAELGRVWVTRDDRLVTRARGSELTGPVRGTLSDWHGEAITDATHCCYRDPMIRFGTDGLVNRAVGARRVPPPGDGSTPSPSAIVQVDDTLAQARWTDGVPMAHEDRTLELETDAQLTPWAEWLVLSASTPDLRVDSVVPAPSAAGPAAWQAVCSTDIGDRWHFRLHPDLGTTVARTLGVVGIEHDITPEGWQITWSTVGAPTPGDANPSGWFVVDLSELDGQDVLPPFGGAVPS